MWYMRRFLYYELQGKRIEPSYTRRQEDRRPTHLYLSMQSDEGSPQGFSKSFCNSLNTKIPFNSYMFSILSSPLNCSTILSTILFSLSKASMKHPMLLQKIYMLLHAFTRNPTRFTAKMLFQLKNVMST